MSMYSKKNKISDKTKEESMKIARGTQRPGQTKEQTKLIAQGIQKGISQYKKQQNEKARELDKKHKKAAASRNSNKVSTDNSLEPAAVKSNTLPWLLLIISWLVFAVYIVLIR
ncbi:MAG: DUF2956 domain-containing protein [Pseudomonadota bacterium]|nr:DUF2956 domain-containing protein [Pseudomonadota bacterium]